MLLMYFLTSSYHQNLLNDKERIAFFQESLSDPIFKDKKIDLTYDLGCGCGILSYFASKISKKVIAIDKDPVIVEMAKKNLEGLSNIEIICEDILEYKFSEMADLIICETLDTGLIDEEQAPIINCVLKYLKDDGIMIPDSVINMVEPVNVNNNSIHYKDVDFDISNNYWESDNKNGSFQVLGYSEILNTVDFYEYNDLNINIDLKFKSNINGNLNAIKITSFTKFRDNLIIGPSPMLNPPLFIPLENKEINKDEEIKINVKFKMGGGLESIKSEYVGGNV